MARLERPHIPLTVRLEVIARQLRQADQMRDVLLSEELGSSGKRLDFMLHAMFGDARVHLDHDPPLMLRRVIDAAKGRYDPSANDPEYLLYRTAEAHRLKTFVRGDGAQLSDAGKRRKEIRRKRKEKPRRSRWPPRGSRPLRGRS